MWWWVLVAVVGGWVGRGWGWGELGGGACYWCKWGCAATGRLESGGWSGVGAWIRGGRMKWAHWSGGGEGCGRMWMWKDVDRGSEGGEGGRNRLCGSVVEVWVRWRWRYGVCVEWVGGRREV